MSSSPWNERKGWKLYVHPAFRKQYDELVDHVARLRRKPSDAAFRKHGQVKLLARINKLILDDIPNDPGAKVYVQGNTLGSGRRHWRRAKFFERFRLFFRFHSERKIIVYALMNDANTLRARGSASDVYSVFRRRLAAGDPPDDWDDLLRGSL